MPKKGPNKAKAWRKIKHQFNPTTAKIERYGRRFRNAMHQLDSSAGLHPIVIWMMKSGGISTPKFDSVAETTYNEDISGGAIDAAN